MGRTLVSMLPLPRSRVSRKRGPIVQTMTFRFIYRKVMFAIGHYSRAIRDTSIRNLLLIAVLLPGFALETLFGITVIRTLALVSSTNRLNCTYSLFEASKGDKDTMWALVLSPLALTLVRFRYCRVNFAAKYWLQLFFNDHEESALHYIEIAKLKGRAWQDEHFPILDSECRVVASDFELNCACL